jgi:hypothetical protein
MMSDPSLNPYAPPGTHHPTVARLRSGLNRVVAVLLVLGGLTGLYVQIALWRWIAAQTQVAASSSAPGRPLLVSSTGTRWSGQ